MSDPKRLLASIGIPNWAAGGGIAALVLLLLSVVFSATAADAPVQFVQMVYQSALVIAGLVGLPLAIWRSWTAHQQAKTGQKQLEGFQTQVRLLEAGAEADRLQKGVELLEADKLIVRIAGVAILRRIAVEPSHTFCSEAFRVLNAFAKTSSAAQPEFNRNDDDTKSPEDLVEAFKALIAARETSGQVIASLHIRGHHFSGLSVNSATSFGITFNDCYFSKSSFTAMTHNDYSSCAFFKCSIEFANYDFTDYSDCRFSRSRISGTSSKDDLKHKQFIECDFTDFQSEMLVAP